MAENDDVPGSPDADVDPVTEPVQPLESTPPAPVLKTRWRDRAWSFRAMLAVALASVLIGGVGGAAIVAASGDDNDGRVRMSRFGPGGMMPPGMGNRMPRNRGNGPNGPNGHWEWQDDGQVPTPNPEGPTPVPPTPDSTG